MSLVVYYLDDEDGLCENFKDLFESESVKIETFNVPAKLIERVKMTPPHLIFLDYRLPNTTGDKVAAQLDINIPKILITGDIEIHTDYKFHAILEKPTKSERIDALLKEFSRK